MAEIFNVKKYYDDLTKLFKSGPLVRHRVASKIAAPGQVGVPVGTARAFLKHVNTSYTSALASYGQYSRLARYSDYNEMESMPEINSALNLYAEEVCSKNEFGELLKIESSNVRIKDALMILFYDVLNVEFNAGSWVRNFCKYGDQFLLVDHHPDHGIMNVLPMPVNEVEREEGYDPENPLAYRYRWITQGNRVLENWQVIHFRLLNNDNFLPYGSSILEPARRVWRQLILMEDAVMVYRIVRSPERRVFYIGVGNVSPQDVPTFMEKAKTQLKRNQIVDSNTGRVDLRYNPMCHFPNDYVYLADGTRKKIKEIATNFDKYKDIWVWSLNEQNNVVPTKLIWAGKTRDKTKFTEVTLDDGQIIRTTSNHKWILRDGTLVEAKDLKSDMKVMPFYCQVDTKLTQRFGDSKNNFYVDYYNPGSGKWTTGHKIVGQFKYGLYSWPDIIHHKNHIKYNNDFDNLEKMNQRQHMVEHSKNVKNLNEYAKSEEGRKNSSDNMKENWAKGFISSATAKELWQNKEIRKKRIEALTLKTDSVLIKFVGKALSFLGNEAREHQVRDFLNNDVEFIGYLISLNQNFKNGFNYKLTKNQFRYALRKNNFNNLRDVKDFYASLIAPWDKITEYCAINCPTTRKQVFSHFGISKYDFMRILQKNKLSGDEFDGQFLGGGYYKIAKLQKQQLSVGEYKNHTIISVKESDFECEAYGLTVENSTHIVAIGGENAKTLSKEVPRSGVFIKQSTDEDYFVPVRGEGDGTKIDTLPGGQFTGDIDDLVYIQNKLFAALKVPKSYLGYEGDVNAKSTLSQEDVRFARTIQHIQRIFTAELNKIAVIHLYSMGFTGEDLVNFEISMANPSTISELQHLELWRSKFEVASLAQEGMFDKNFVYSKIFKLSNEDIAGIEEGKRKDVLFDAELQSIQGSQQPAEEEAPADTTQAPEAGLPPPPGESSSLDTAAKDPNKQIGAPNELVKVDQARKERSSSIPDLYNYATNMKKTALDPKRNHSELTRIVKAPFGEGDISRGTNIEERLFAKHAAQLQKFAEDLKKIDTLRTAHIKKTKKVLSD